MEDLEGCGYQVLARAEEQIKLMCAGMFQRLTLIHKQQLGKYEECILQLKSENKNVYEAFFAYRAHILNTVELFNYDPNINALMEAYASFELGFRTDIDTLQAGYMAAFEAEQASIMSTQFYSAAMVSK